MIIRTLEATVHGRYLFQDRGAERLLIGFHGYGEVAESLRSEVETIPGIERWSVASVQALHPFYTRSGSVVASWMTSLDREFAIQDNLGYVRSVIADLPTPRVLVFLGFSQGATMAARAAASAGNADGIILLGGDIPPEIHDDPSVTLPPVLLGRGENDDWYNDEKFKKDLSYLERTTRVTACPFTGGHEWTGEFREAAGRFLAAL